MSFLLFISNFNKILVIIRLLHPSCISQLAPINIEQSFLFDISEISEIVHGWPGGQGVRVPGEAGAVITGEKTQTIRHLSRDVTLTCSPGPRYCHRMSPLSR